MEKLKLTEALLCCLLLPIALGCADQSAGPSGGEPAAATEQSAAPEPEAALESEGESDAVDVVAIAAAVGVEPGGLEPDPGMGAEAVIAMSVGDVQVRRTGEELFAVLSGDAPELHAGDQLQTGVDGNALLLLSDGTQVEVAEDTVVAIGDREAGTAPANAIAVLIGVARFTVSPRAEGEGAFIVYTAAGAVVATGTIFTIGASATGSIRVGVSSGSVQVAAAAALDVTTAIVAGKAIDVDVAGKLSAPVELKADAWGSWRDEEESKLDVTAVAELQLAASAKVEAEVVATYEVLEELAADAQEAEVEAAALEEADDSAGYAASAEARAATLEAGLLTSLRLQQQTFAMLARAHVLHELHRRHPEKLRASVGKARRRHATALLYHKKFHVTAHQKLRPLRAGYHKHHAHGRRQARALGHEVSAFCLKTKLEAPGDAKVGARAKLALLRPPKVKKHHTQRKLSRRGPPPNWHAAKIAKIRAVRKASADEAAGEGKGKAAGRGHGHAKRFLGFYRRPAQASGKLLAGLPAKEPPRRVFRRSKRKPRHAAKLRWSTRRAKRQARKLGKHDPLADREGRPNKPIKVGKAVPPGLAKRPGEPAEGHGAKRPKLRPSADGKTKGADKKRDKPARSTAASKDRKDRKDRKDGPRGAAKGPGKDRKHPGKHRGKDEGKAPGKGHGKR